MCARVNLEWYERYRISRIKIRASSVSGTPELCVTNDPSHYFLYMSSRLNQHSCVTLQEVTSLNSHSIPLPTQQPHLPLEPHWLRGAACNVTAIFYSCRWSVWVALLETGTQSPLPVNTNLLCPTGWEELRQLGEDGIYKK